MNNIILDGFESDELVSALGNPNLSMFIRELNHVYGLKAYCLTKPNEKHSPHIMLSRDNGLPVCEVYTRVEDNKVVYNYYSPYYAKARGRDDRQRHTLQSTKISTLMGVLKSKQVVAETSKLLGPISNYVGSMQSLVRRRVGGDINKSLYSVDVQLIHDLLKAALSGNPNQEIHKLDTKKYKEYLDGFDKADENRKNQEERVNEVFGRPYHIIGIDNNNQYVVATFAPNENAKTMASPDAVFLNSFKRHKTLLDCGIDDLIPTMVMFKTMLEGNPQYSSRHAVGSDVVVPVTDDYIPELDVVLYYPGTPTNWQYQWVLTPAG